MAKHDDEFEGRDTVTLTLDDDSELECIVLNIFKGGDREYIALLPTEGIEAEEGTVYLYRYEEDEQGNPNLTNIESDEEYEIASDAFDEMLDDEEYDEVSQRGRNLQQKKRMQGSSNCKLILNQIKTLRQI